MEFEPLDGGKSADGEDSKFLKFKTAGQTFEGTLLGRAAVVKFGKAATAFFLKAVDGALKEFSTRDAQLIRDLALAPDGSDIQLKCIEMKKVEGFDNDVPVIKAAKAKGKPAAKAAF